VGVVHVSAKDLGTGKEQSITITSNTNMSKDDIEKAVKEAEQYAAEDKKRREEVDIVNGADQMVYTTEKMLTDMGDKLSDEEKADIRSGIDALKAEVEKKDIEAIKAKQEELQKKVYAVSEKIYKAAQDAQAAQGANADANAGANADNVYDAEYNDVDETK
ncbi:MAG: Hsp70 family protein, partial [Clostridia bacterium]|nr:Hsp70 family protein [Clostridia bacterium]